MCDVCEGFLSDRIEVDEGVGGGVKGDVSCYRVWVSGEKLPSDEQVSFLHPKPFPLHPHPLSGAIEITNCPCLQVPTAFLLSSG